MTTITVPQNLSSQEAKKFRKDARRRARAQDQPEDQLTFVVEGQAPAPTAGKGETGEGNGNGNRKKRAKKQFPRINDLLSEHAAQQKEDAEKAARVAADDALPPAEKARYVALDCEMVGVGADGRKSALARASAVDWNGKVLLDAFVRVPERVTDFRTRVSGVRPNDIKPTNAAALDHEECRRTVGALLVGKVLVGHALKNDLGVLLLGHPREDVRDTARYKPFMRATGRSGGKLRPRKLRDLVYEKLGRRIQVEGEAHCSVDDAQASMDLFKCVRGPWEKELSAKVSGRGKK
jgi:RNA exonuclease 4